MNKPFWKELTTQDDLEAQYDALCKRGVYTDKQIAMHLARFAEARIFASADAHIDRLEAELAKLKAEAKRHELQLTVYG